MLKKNTNIKLSEALETFAVCLKQKRLVSQRFKQTCVIAYLYIYFVRLFLSGLTGLLAQLANFYRNNIQPSQNVIICYRKMCLRKFSSFTSKNWYSSRNSMYLQCLVDCILGKSL